MGSYAGFVPRDLPSDLIDMDELISLGVLTRPAADFLALCVRECLNIMISGLAGAGKTIVLSALAALIPSDEKVALVNDAGKLCLPQHNVARVEFGQANPGPDRHGLGLRAGIRTALRARPDRVVINDVGDGAAAMTMLRAMVPGSVILWTTDGDSPEHALFRFETMAWASERRVPILGIREMVAAGVDLVVQVGRDRGGRQRISRITGVMGMRAAVVDLEDIFVSDPAAAVDAGRQLETALRPVGDPIRFLGHLRPNSAAIHELMTDQAADDRQDDVRDEPGPAWITSRRLAGAAHRHIRTPPIRHRR